MLKPSLAIAAALLTAGSAHAATLAVPAGPDAQERLQTALLDAKPGDTVRLGAGTFTLTDGLSLDIDRVTVRGAGQDKTILNFAGQRGAGEGLLITSDDVTIRDLSVHDARGDALKAKDADRISFLSLTVAWTGGPKETNGAYGVYPVGSTDVLIDGVTVRGASDAGIYVGQSRNIIVRNSRAEFNVAGIEIENSVGADVHDNVVTHNTGGILVFDLPDLPVQGGHSTRIYNNRIVDNDTANFAPVGNIVASVPVGTGVMLMANRNVHVFDNEISGNQSSGVIVSGYSREIKDAAYEPLPRDIVIRDNRFGRNGWAPMFPGGREIAGAVGGTVPPILWDGATAFTRAGKPETRTVNMRFAQGPVLKLNTPTPGAVAQARPEVLPTVDGAAIAEPAPIRLGPAQAALVR